MTTYPDPIQVRLTITANTPGILDGVVLYTPSDGDVLMSLAAFVHEVFDGTTPNLSVGADKTAALINADLTVTESNPLGGPTVLRGTQGLAGAEAVIEGPPDPIIVWIDDTAGGDPGSTTGIAEVVMLVAPAAASNGGGGSEPTPAEIGPCVDWITADDVAECCGTADCDIPSVFETVAQEASIALYEISGRIFNGVCTRTIRPCSTRCDCWGGSSSISGPWFWSYSYAALTWSWWNRDCGDTCGCTPMETIPIPGYPVQSIVEVLIDGEVVDPSSYRLDNRRDLVRMDDPGPPFQKRYWPSCQNMSLESDQPGTFEITYTWGMAPPSGAKAAANDLACLLFQSCTSGEDGNCQLPAGVTSVTRLGVTIERGLLNHFLDPTQPTGLPNLDIFLRTYYGGKAQRRSAVWSPDIQSYGLRTG